MICYFKWNSPKVQISQNDWDYINLVTHSFILQSSLSSCPYTNKPLLTALQFQINYVFAWNFLFSAILQNVKMSKSQTLITCAPLQTLLNQYVQSVSQFWILHSTLIPSKWFILQSKLRHQIMDLLRDSH